MIAFGALFALVGGIVGFSVQDFSISLWIILGVIVYIIIQYYWSSGLAVMLTHAKPMQPEENIKLYRLVENLAITIGIPTPKIYIINDPNPNAFAAGRNPEKAILGFTTGLLESLDKQELEGVISHEMGHIKNYDVRFKTIILAMVAAMALLVEIAVRMLAASGRSRNNATPVIALISIVVLLIIWPISKLIQAAAGREREYLADMTGAEITRYPEGLASALTKIRDYSGGEGLKVSPNASMLFFADPIKEKKGMKILSWFNGLTATHPPLDDRISRLRALDM